MIVDAFLKAAGFGGGCFSIFSLVYLFVSLFSDLFLHAAGSEHTGHILSTSTNVIQITTLPSHFFAFSSLRESRFALVQNVSIF
jgi:hypothetical protein